MPCFDVPAWKNITHDWFRHQTDAFIRALPFHGGNLAAINSYIHPFFDAHIRDQHNRVCVTVNCPDPWPAVLHPIYVTAGHDVDVAAMYLGNLFCRVAIARLEWWWCSNLPIFTNRPDPAKWKPRCYHIGPKPIV